LDTTVLREAKDLNNQRVSVHSFVVIAVLVVVIPDLIVVIPDLVFVIAVLVVVIPVLFVIPDLFRDL
jgi:hypothetical protein